MLASPAVKGGRLGQVDLLRLRAAIRELQADYSNEQIVKAFGGGRKELVSEWLRKADAFAVDGKPRAIRLTAEAFELGYERLTKRRSGADPRQVAAKVLAQVERDAKGILTSIAAARRELGLTPRGRHVPGAGEALDVRSRQKGREGDGDVASGG